MKQNILLGLRLIAIVAILYAGITQKWILAAAAIVAAAALHYFYKEGEKNG